MSDISNTPIELLLKLKRVKQIYFNLNEKLARMNPEELVDTKINHFFGFNADVNLVNFTITFFIHYANSPDSEKLSEITVENIFEVYNLNEYVINNTAHLPEKILIEIVSTSTSHSRALFSQALFGTPYQNIVIPIADQRRVTALLFPGSILLTDEDHNFMQNIKSKNEVLIKELIKKPAKKKSVKK